MGSRLLLLIVVLFVVVGHFAEAAFFYDPIPPNSDELESRDLKCIPGKTLIRITNRVDTSKGSTEEEGDAIDGRRSHMNFETHDENCLICVCSVEGKDEYCSKRPAKNVNECIRMAKIKEEMARNLPFTHEKSLPFRIRRDYIWHRDEIPYESKAKCYRGNSYYSNSYNANDTDIDVASEVESILDYNNSDVCYFCVCAVDGKAAGCIPRDVWYCEYYKILRKPIEIRNRYAVLFQQDRPAYFRQLSYRLRRTMDDAMNALIDGGDTLCCSHPNGHRRNLHEQIRNKIRQMRRKVPKENILSGSPAGDYVDFIVNNDK